MRCDHDVRCLDGECTPDCRVLIHRLLESDATYCEIANDGTDAVLEVIDAPGLEPGTRVRMAAREADAMEVLT